MFSPGGVHFGGGKSEGFSVGGDVGDVHIGKGARVIVKGNIYPRDSEKVDDNEVGGDQDTAPSEAQDHFSHSGAYRDSLEYNVSDLS